MGRELVRITGTVDVPAVFCSRRAVEQILDVLLDNAMQHGRGAVTVTFRIADTAVAIDVTDEGSGLSGDPQALFVRRSAPSLNHRIGLTLARTLAEAEGGRLVVSRRNPPTFTLLMREATAR